MEKDDELKGIGNSYTTEFRQYDPRIGRWLSPDPLQKQLPWESPYVAMDNKPIIRNDVDGDCPTCVSGFVISGLMEMAFQIGEHMFQGDDFETALKKVDYVSVLGQASLGALTGSLDGGVSKFVGALADPKKAKILSKVLEFGAGMIIDQAAQAGYDASGIEDAINGLAGKEAKTFQQIGEIASQETESTLKSSYENELKSGKYGISKEVFAENLEGGKDTYFDFVVFDKKSGNIIEVVESKGHFHTTKSPISLKGGQKDFYDLNKKFKFGTSGSVPDILKGKSVSKEVVQKATVMRWSVNKYSGKAEKLAKDMIEKIVKRIKK